MTVAPPHVETRELINTLSQYLYEARDLIYEIAGTLLDSRRKLICYYLADNLGGYAADLQQLATQEGPQSDEDPATLIDLPSHTDEMLRDLDVVTFIDAEIIPKYDAAVSCSLDRQTCSQLRKQRTDVFFSESVLALL